MFLYPLAIPNHQKVLYLCDRFRSMRKKKTISRLDVLTLYMDFVSDHEAKPNSIEDFCEKVNLEQEAFEKHFSSFNKMDKTIFLELFKNSMEVLEESEEFLSFDSKNKLISFYFTFFENLSLNRSYVKTVLAGCTNQLKSFKTLSLLKKDFLKFIESLSLTESIIPVEGLENIQQRFISETMWFQLIATIRFWLEDHSETFEKTDIFIEKSINTSFELLENKFLKNAFDLGKFILKEKFSKE